MDPIGLTKPAHPLSSSMKYRGERIIASGAQITIELANILRAIKTAEAYQNDVKSHLIAMSEAAHSAYVIGLERDALAAAIKDIVANMNGDLAAVWTKHPIIEVALAS